MARDEQRPETRAPLGTRLLWFAGLWLASVACIGAVALAIKWALK